MFDIILRDPNATPDNPFKINFLDEEIPPAVSNTIFVMWIWDEELST
jgi:hypothetical protein